MKRKLSVLLAAAMAVTMLPMNVIAKTTSEVGRSITAAKNQDLVLSMPKDDEQIAPLLRLKVEDDGIGVEGDVFRISLDNADWKYRTYDCYDGEYKNSPHAVGEPREDLYYADYELGNGRFESYPVKITKILGNTASIEVLDRVTNYDYTIMGQAFKGELDYREANFKKAVDNLKQAYADALNNKAISTEGKNALSALNNQADTFRNAISTEVNSIRGMVKSFTSSNLSTIVGTDNNLNTTNGTLRAVSGTVSTIETLNPTANTSTSGLANSLVDGYTGYSKVVSENNILNTDSTFNGSNVYSSKAVDSVTNAWAKVNRAVADIEEAMDKIAYDLICLQVGGNEVNGNIVGPNTAGNNNGGVNYKGNPLSGYINTNLRIGNGNLHYNTGRFNVKVNNVYNNGYKYTVGGYVVVPMTTRVKEGVAKVTVEPLNSGITATTWEFANGSGGGTSLSVSGDGDFNYISDSFKIILDELRANSVDTGKGKQIRLKAPAGFNWVGNGTQSNNTTNLFPNVTVNGINGLKDASYTYDNSTEGIKNGYAKVGSTYTANYGKYNYGTGTGSTSVVVNPDGTTTTTIVSGQTGYDQETIVFETIGDGYQRSIINDKSVGTIFFENLRLYATDAALEGEVFVEISGDGITEQKVKVGNYKGFGVSVKSEAPTTVISGRGVQDLAKVTLQENVKGSWLGKRKTTFNFPEGVKVVGATIKTEDIANLNSDTTYKFTERGQSELNGAVKDTLYTDLRWFGKSGSGSTSTGSVTGNNASIEFKGNVVEIGNLDISGKAKMEITFQVTAKPGVEGDIELKVDGLSLTEGAQVVVPGKVISPITLTTEVTEINIGYKNLALADLVIKENVAGAIQKAASNTNVAGNKTVQLGVEGTLSTNGIKTGKWEVTDGDILINPLTNSSITVKRASTKPSTIKVSGITIDVDRTPAEGMYWLGLGGGALVENYKETNSIIKFDEPYYKVSTVEVVTAAPDKDTAYTRSAVFTIGSTKMLINGVEQTLDVAPYIADNRTMLPLRAVASALGVPETSMIYDDVKRTATVVKGNITLQVKVGSKEMLINGSPITMDTEAVIKEDRMFVPIAYLASGLQVTYTWDDATKTATFNPQNTEEQSSQNKKEASSSQTDKLPTTDEKKAE